jgi:glycosyltransferase involved in cell wall biosynthesis
MAPWLATAHPVTGGSTVQRKGTSQRFFLAPGMSALAASLAAAPLVIALYAYLGYPMVLWAAAKVRRQSRTTPIGTVWPSVTVTVPVYNAESSIKATLDAILSLDYERAKLQILVISDASTDGTDEIVRGLRDHGIELLRLPERRGKTVAENTALGASRGEILVNVDSTILVTPPSLKRLVRAFDDPTIGVASGRDVSTGEADREGTRAESDYVGYEMWVRELETQVGSIVGASGCFYGARRCIHGKPLPPGLSWDFASALNARLQGYRSVSVNDAICIVPRAREIRSELTRKVRTMARGIGTLFYFRALMNPFAYGSFAFMLISHKLLRWLPYLLAPLAYVALCYLAVQSVAARVIVGLATAGLVAGFFGIRSVRSRPSKPIALAGFLVAVCSAGFLAWVAALRNTQLAMWEPTHRPEVQPRESLARARL